MIIPEHALKKTPVVIATGFTAAYLGDERSLREFIVGDHLLQTISQKGENAVLYLINDSYDSLTYNQLRVAANKDQKLIDAFKHHCGLPIAEVPCPFECHASFSDHFIDALMQRLRSLDIHPVVLDTYNAYKAGHYSKYIDITFENYNNIVRSLTENFDSYSMKNLFRIQCIYCSKLDDTHILRVQGKNVKYACHHCNETLTQSVDYISGKLSWKLDCAARWNIYDIDLEPFSKAHVHDLGSLAISKFISEQYYENKVPEFINYGMVRISRDMSYKLLEILPPQMLKQFFIERVSKDIMINKDAVLNFSQNYYIRPGTNYMDFVAQELPHLALQDKKQMEKKQSSLYGNLNLETLIEFGKRYSSFYFNKEHKIMLPDASYILSQDKETASIARDILQYALEIRDNTEHFDVIKTQIADYIDNYKKQKSKVSPYLRRVLGQSKGPTISTLLATLPYDHIKLTYTMLCFYVDKTD